MIEDRAREPVQVLIIGGGVIGASIAYFLARRGAEPIVFERTGMASAASGKSANSWRSTGAMARRFNRSRGGVLCAARRARGGPWRQDLGLSAARDLWRLRKRAKRSIGRRGAVDWVGSGVTINQRLSSPERRRGFIRRPSHGR